MKHVFCWSSSIMLQTEGIFLKKCPRENLENFLSQQVSTYKTCKQHNEFIAGAQQQGTLLHQSTKYQTDEPKIPLAGIPWFGSFSKP